MKLNNDFIEEKSESAEEGMVYMEMERDEKPFHKK